MQAILKKCGKGSLYMQINFKIIPKFESLFKGDLDKYRVILYYGGRGGGKSESIIRFLFLKCLQSNTKCYIVREVEKSKRDNIHALAKRIINENMLFDYCKQTLDRISFINGSEITMSALSNLTADNMRGLDNIRYFWFDEAHSLSEDSYNVLEPSVRANDSQLIFSFNPQTKEDFLYKNFIARADEWEGFAKCIQINISDNPLAGEILLKSMEQARLTMPHKMFLHIWGGEPSNYNDMQVINSELIGYYNDTQSYKYADLIVSCDTAFSIKTSADYSVLAVLGIEAETKNFHLLHLARGQWDFHSLCQNAQNIYQLCERLAGRHPSVMLIENKASGQSMIQEIQRLTNIPIRAVSPITDKLTRIVDSFLPNIERLKLPMSKENPFNKWIPAFLSECEDFRADNKHKHDDQIDAVTQGVNYLALKGFDYAKIKEAFSNFNTRRI